MLERLNLAIVDVETTGGCATDHRIIEIGLTRGEQGRVTDTYSSLVNPERPIPWIITAITGITDQDVEDAPTFAAIHRTVRSLLDGCVFVAHNAPFDYGFLQQEFERLGQSFCADRLCTVRLSRTLYPRYRRHSLGHLIERFQLPCERRHRALDDANVVWAFLQHAQQTLAPERLASAGRHV